MPGGVKQERERKGKMIEMKKVVGKQEETASLGAEEQKFALTDRRGQIFSNTHLFSSGLRHRSIQSIMKSLEHFH